MCIVVLLVFLDLDMYFGYKTEHKLRLEHLHMIASVNNLSY